MQDLLGGSEAAPSWLEATSSSAQELERLGGSFWNNEAFFISSYFKADEEKKTKTKLQEGYSDSLPGALWSLGNPRTGLQFLPEEDQD